MKSTPSPAIELFLLGSPRLVKAGADHTKALKYRKAWSLLGHLIAHAGQWQTRDKLGDLLWPELELSAAKSNLRQVLSNVSGLLTLPGGHSPLERNDSAVRWVPCSGLWVDLQWLSNESLAKAGSVDPKARQWCVEALEPHLEALSGLFLDGVQIPNAPDHERWLQSARGFYRSRSLLLLEQTGHRQQEEGRLDDAIATARLLVEREPLDEGCITRLMNLLARQERHPEALAVYDKAAQVRREQLGLPPGKGLQACHAALQSALHKPPRQPAADVPELRWVAALYADFPQASAMDEEENDAVRATFAEVVNRFGGRVFPTAGTGVLAVFGVAGAGERAAFRALLSAQDLLAWGRSRGGRMGIGCGKVLFRPGAGGTSLSGEAVDLAMRICLTAEPGEVLLSVDAAAQIGHAATFSDAGAWTFRGLEGSHPLKRWTEVGAEEADALAHGTRTEASLPFTGRADELARLLARWQQAVVQGGQVVVVRAPAGHGKTRLLQEFSRRVQASGATCVQVVCRLETQHQPMAPFLAVLDVPARPAGMELDSKSEAFARVQEALERLMTDGPVLLLLDDMHWADLATQEFLPMFARTLEGRKAMLVLATRPGLEVNCPLSTEVVELRPLADNQARELVLARQSAAGADTHQADWIVATAGGVPLFLELLTKSQPGQGVRQHMLSIRDVLQSELDQLGGGKAVLRAAAVMGMRFFPDGLGLLLGEQDVGDALVRAQSLALIDADEAGGYRFHHALIHDAVYESVPLGQRRSLHRSWAVHLQSLPGSQAEDVARHWEAAQGWEHAARWWAQAGDAALQREFAADAVASLQRALAMLGQLGETERPLRTQQDIQLRLGYALHMAEGFGSPSAWRLFKAVAEQMEGADQNDPDNQAMLFTALSGCYMGGSSQGQVDGLHIAERLSDLALTEAQQLMAAFALGNSLFWRGEFDEAGHWQAMGIALSQRLPAKERVRYCVDDPAIICRAFLAWNRWFQGRDAEATAMTDEALQWARSSPRMHGRCFGFGLLQCLYWCQGRMEPLQSLSTQTLSLARQFGFPLWESASGLHLAAVLAHSGAMDDVGPLFDAAQRMQQAYQAGITTSRWIVAGSLVAQGEWAQAKALLDVSIAEADRYEDQYCIPAMLWLRARCWANLGEPDHCTADQAQARELAHRMGAMGELARFDAESQNA